MTFYSCTANSLTFSCTDQSHYSPSLQCVHWNSIFIATVGEPREEHIIVVSDSLLKELTSLKVSYARFLCRYMIEIKNSSEAQEEFIGTAKTILGRELSSSDFQTCFDTLVDKEVSLFNITYLKEICEIFPEDVW